MICYFSGTGNSKYVAEEIAKGLSEDLLDVNKRIKNNDISDVCVNGRLIIVTPTYAWRIPKVVYKWILDTKFIGVKEIYYVMTCGDENGNADKYNQKLSRLKGFVYKGTFEVVMPENYIALFDTPNSDKAKKIICLAKDKIKKIVDDISSCKEIIYKPNLRDKFKSGFVNGIFYPVFVSSKKFYVKDSCIGCGRCVGLCPFNNIHLKDNKPVWDNNCTHCMACISYCPTEAIEYGSKSIGKERYYFKNL